MTPRAWTLLLILGAFWGASYLLIKVGLRDLDPAVIACSRVLLAAIVLVPLALWRRTLPGLRGRLGFVVALALVQVAGPFLLIAAGEQHIPSSLTGILVASTPLFTALLAIRVDREERSRGLGVAGLLAGFAGVALIIGLDVSGDAAALIAAGAVLLASLGYAIGGFMVKHGSRGERPLDPIALAAGTMIASIVLTLPPAVASAPSAVPGLVPLAAIVALGVLGTGVSFAIFHTLLAEVGPARSSLVTYIAPAFALVYGVTLLGERVTAAALAGLALIVAGSWLGARGTAAPVPAASARPAAELAS